MDDLEPLDSDNDPSDIEADADAKINPFINTKNTVHLETIMEVDEAEECEDEIVEGLAEMSIGSDEESD